MVVVRDGLRVAMQWRKDKKERDHRKKGHREREREIGGRDDAGLWRWWGLANYSQQIEEEEEEEEKAMGPDSILNASLPALSKDLGKKKRTNRLAKLKQSKLDVRREQCLSQGAVNYTFELLLLEYVLMLWSNERSGFTGSIAYEGNRSKENIKLRSRKVDAEGSSFHESDMDSLMSSSVSSSLGQHDSMKDLPGTSCSSASSMCFSRSVSEADEDDGCLDDWEAVADALSADENQNLDLQAGLKTKIVLADHELPKKNCGVNVIKIESKVMVPRSHSNDLNCRAWCPDDALRPRGLPNLSKKHTLTMNSEWLCGHGTIARGWQSVLSQPSPCPICYEDLDVTDSKISCKRGLSSMAYVSSVFLFLFRDPIIIVEDVIVVKESEAFFGNRFRLLMKSIISYMMF
ncbi:hypothetical protein HYC85_002962 [Camellia sinensis]|uniref:RING-type domain-containing protein n=1 Tax=Camellia sinensis TaxID=4442 RepID=A0A7J7I9R9_CAMSI|nr:hypothetical protein HYC85_002962 [Camellia sinensis]